MVQCTSAALRRRRAMACREFSLWYNGRPAGRLRRKLWLVGNSRYGTMNGVEQGAKRVLWLVGNSRYGTIDLIVQWRREGYGL